MNDYSSYWDIEHSQYGPVEAHKTSRFDRVAGNNLTAANVVIPQVTHHDEVDASQLEMVRAQYKAESKARGVKLTTLPFFVKALAVSLRKFPKFNSSLSPDGETLYLKDYIHVGIAVDTEHGLMVPVIRDADRKGLWQIAEEIVDLATRAKSRKLVPEEMGGASMTITNLGGIGGTSFSPIVNPPEVAILGITRMQHQPVWNGEAFVATPMVPLDLSYDHRVINGADAARFLSEYARSLADIRLLLV
ncbi:MAG: 2-oxo acid dehydrogenase subunit E2 [Natronospirillum sp.]|uniref:2-oxo acid dehydrogenase subunit E2 n=1 Tax=Natronospirillum sp. TaxID=2812955 RepID=UPI0025DE848C|nr:2-oxo acid dehydrogenase subunit E2 [Natronospirillum sp.]MCH8550874.1 2-oxo acid dehydrogenase subunit E2 [Natronospirillum sp.]